MARRALKGTFSDRGARAKYIFDMHYRNNKTMDEIAKSMKMSRTTIQNDIRWYRDGIGKEELEEVKRLEAKKAEDDKLARESKKLERINKKNERARNIISRLMSGVTIAQISKEIDRTPITINKIIKEYEKVDPSFVAQYRKVAKTHHFGHGIKD